MTSIRAIADDLTGALDAGAAFTGMCGPLPVGWRANFRPQAESYIIDSETRGEIDAAIALQRAQRHLAAIAGADYPFKKIDSLIRGHTVAELSACIQSNRFASVVVAPAFPKQRRITENGQQYADFDGAGDWTPAGVNLAEALQPHSTGGVGVQTLESDATAEGSGVFVCDAATDAELTSLPERVSAIARPVLWCGTAGLAHALAGNAAPQRLPAGSALVVIGSHHRVSQHQVEALAKKSPEALRYLDGSLDPKELWSFLDRRLRNGEVAAIAANLGVIDNVSAHQKLGSIFRGVLSRLPRPDLIVVAGGETLLLVLDAAGAQSALVEGEVLAGVARGRVVGGIWDGTVFASKSGAFGAASTLVDLLASRRGGEIK